MRKITSHIVNGLNEALEIQVLDEPGPGGACHQYFVQATGPIVIDPHMEEAERDRVVSKLLSRLYIDFQNGPIAEVGVNGISNEVLLAIVLDRLEGFQSGEYACAENQAAVEAVNDALLWLQKRTRERAARGVEGTSQK
jgi:hypothetical protein